MWFFLSFIPAEIAGLSLRYSLMKTCQPQAGIFSPGIYRRGQNNNIKTAASTRLMNR
jgi:hypothetical protein